VGQWPPPACRNSAVLPLVYSDDRKRFFLHVSAGLFVGATNGAQLPAAVKGRWSHQLSSVLFFYSAPRRLPSSPQRLTSTVNAPVRNPAGAPWRSAVRVAMGDHADDAGELHGRRAPRCRSIARSALRARRCVRARQPDCPSHGPAAHLAVSISSPLARDDHRTITHQWIEPIPTQPRATREREDSATEVRHRPAHGQRAAWRLIRAAGAATAPV
jgi:hypothetical protein